MPSVHWATISFALLSACSSSRVPGPPARLSVGADDTLVLNNRRPVQIPMRALDAAGREVPVTGVRYEWSSGDSLQVTADGRVTCTRNADASIRAALGSIATNVVLRCRPVQKLHIAGPIQFVLGDSSQVIPLEATGLDGRPVLLIAGTVSTMRADVVAMEGGLRVRALTAGVSLTSVQVGDEQARVGVHVYEPVSTLNGLRADQQLVIVPLRLASGEVRRWHLPAGIWMLTMMPYEGEMGGLRLRVEGAQCMPAPITRRRIVCELNQSATVMVYHPSTITAPALTGALLAKR